MRIEVIPVLDSRGGSVYQYRCSSSRSPRSGASASARFLVSSDPTDPRARGCTDVRPSTTNRLPDLPRLVLRPPSGMGANPIANRLEPRPQAGLGSGRRRLCEGDMASISPVLVVPVDRVAGARPRSASRDEAEALAGAARVQRAARLAVRLGGVPADRRPRTASGATMSSTRSRIVISWPTPRFTGSGAVVALGREDDALGRVVDVEELARRRARAPDLDVVGAPPRARRRIS